MPQYIEVDGEVIEFPDGMSDAEIAAAIQGQQGFGALADGAQQAVDQTAAQMGAGDLIPGRAGAAVSALSQGLTLGFGDELAAALNAPVAAALQGDVSLQNIAQQYQTGVESVRAQQERQREQFPLAYGASELVGGAATGAAGAAGLGARGLLGALGAGAGAGGLAGAGYADAETLGEFAGDVAGGAALGAAGGAALSGLGRLGRAALRRVTQTPQTRAAQMLADADPEFGAALRQAKEAVSEGREAVAADFASRRAKALLRSAARRPSPGQDLAEQVLDTRSAGQYSRLQGAIDDAFDVQRSYAEEFEYLNQAKQAIAGDLYETAFQQPTPLTPKLRNLMQRPAMQRSLARAQQIADIEGGQLDPNILAATQGAAREGAQADTRTLHYMRRALDDQINNLRDATTGRFRQPEVARALTNLRRDFNEALTQNNKPFERADEVWGGLERSRQAMESGVRAAGKTTERSVRFSFDKVAPQDRQFFEIGYAQGLNEKIGRSGSDFTNLAARLRSPEQQNSIRVVLGDQRARQLLDTIEAEDAFSRTRNLISPNVGSPTYELAAQDPFISRALQAVSQPVSAGARFADDALRLGQAARQSAIDEQLLQLGVGSPAQAAQAFTPPPPAIDVTAPLAGGLSPLTVQLLRE